MDRNIASGSPGFGALLRRSSIAKPLWCQPVHPGAAGRIKGAATLTVATRSTTPCPELSFSEG